MKKLSLLIAIMALSLQPILAQNLKLSGEIRPRAEVRNGYKQLMATGSELAFFVSQRSRLNFNFTQDKLEFKVTMQNTRIWGDIGTLSSNDKSGIALHETWAKYQFKDYFGIKLGRQEIVYDDHRIFGSVGWAQQARSHDAALFLFNLNKKGKIDVGLAYNANKASLSNEDYTINQYRSLQYLHYQVGLKNNFKLSILFLNNGLTYTTKDSLSQKITNSQTIGGRLSYKKAKLSSNAAFYSQIGYVPTASKIGTTYQSAYYLALDLNYSLLSNYSIGASAELLSGNDMSSTSHQNNAFTPYYGTNHKFNGLMDYFYVGNHNNSVGLIDLSIPVKYKKDHLSIGLTAHYFLADGSIISNNETLSSHLGTEIDLTCGYQFNSIFKLNAGYSQMFATNTLQALTGGNNTVTNNWAWVMLTFKPTLFDQTK